MVSRRRWFVVLVLLLWCGLSWGARRVSAEIPTYTLLVPDEDVQIVTLDHATNAGVGIKGLVAAHVYPSLTLFPGLDTFGLVKMSVLRASAGEIVAGNVFVDHREHSIPFFHSPALGLLNLLAGTEWATGFVARINPDGRIAGTIRQLGNSPQQAATAFQGSFTLLAPLSERGRNRDSGASGINAAGSIVGYALGNEPQVQPVMWAVDGTIAVVGGGSLGGGMAFGINDAGTIIGASLIPCGTSGWALAPDGVTVTPLPPLPGSTHSVPNDVNTAGLIVGMSMTIPASCNTAAAVQRATIWEAGVPTELATRVTDLEGWQLQRALAITDAGLVLVTGVQNARQRNLVLLPQPAASAPSPEKPAPRRPRK